MILMGLHLDDMHIVSTQQLRGHNTESGKRHSSVPIEWIFEFSQYLFEKYIQSSSDLCVNLSGCTRHSLCQFFSLSADEAFEHIRDHRFDELTDHERDLIGQNPKAHDLKLIKTYLYHCFDIAFNNIWSLLRDDVFLRFQCTEEYRELNLSKRKKRKASSVSPQGNMPKGMPVPNPILVSNTTFSVGSIQFSASPSLRGMHNPSDIHDGIHPLSTPPRVSPEPLEHTPEDPPPKTSLQLVHTMTPRDSAQSAPPSIQSTADKVEHIEDHHLDHMEIRMDMISDDDPDDDDDDDMDRFVILEEPEESAVIRNSKEEDLNDVRLQIQISPSPTVSVDT